MTPLAPIKLLPARDRVAAALREAILTHRMNAGDEVTLKATAEMLGVSVTPVREAFQMLARDGLIELRPNKGAVILGLNEKRIRDHYNTRALLESEAARAVCRNHAPLSAIENVYAQAADALAHQNIQDYGNYNQSFHMEIWNAGGNEVAAELLAGLWNGLSIGQRVTKEEYAKISMAEHAKLLSALQARNEQLAGELMTAHIHRSMENVLTHMQKGEVPEEL